MSRTCRAAVLERFESPLTLQSFPVPAALEPGAVLVRTEMAGICGTDVHLWKGQLPIALPVILGHETVGRIEALGDGVDRDWAGIPLAVGDRITWNSALSCGRCVYCRQKRQPTRCRERRAYGIGYRCDRPPHLLGGYADFHYLNPGATLFRLPEALPTEAVIGAGCALITAIHGLERMGVDWLDRVVIQGAGPVGLAALAVARSRGAAQIMVIGGPRPRLDMALRFGADVVVGLDEAPDSAARIRRVREWTGGEGADAVVECVGSPDAVAEGLEMSRDGGRYLVLGHYCDAGSIPLNPHVITRKQLQVIGSWSSEPRHLLSALDFLLQNRERFPFHSLVSHRFPLDQAHEALMTTARWEAVKSVIVPI